MVWFTPSLCRCRKSLNDSLRNSLATAPQTPLRLQHDYSVALFVCVHKPETNRRHIDVNPHCNLCPKGCWKEENENENILDKCWSRRTNGCSDDVCTLCNRAAPNIDRKDRHLQSYRPRSYSMCGLCRAPKLQIYDYTCKTDQNMCRGTWSRIYVCILLLPK